MVATYLWCEGTGQELLAACPSTVHATKPCTLQSDSTPSQPMVATYLWCEGTGQGLLAACQGLQQRRGDGHAVGASQGADLIQGVIPSGAVRVEA